MVQYYYGVDFDSFRYISHHGIKGQKWGIRRFQNQDGSLTSAGEKRYNSGESSSYRTHSGSKPISQNARKTSKVTVSTVGSKNKHSSRPDRAKVDEWLRENYVYYGHPGSDEYLNEVIAMPRVYYGTDFDSFRYISHHGILGMKWGVRRFQNKDGTRTALGKKRQQRGREQSKSRAIAALENGYTGGSKQRYIEDITSDCWLTTSSSFHPKNAEEKERANSAADLGLEALERMNPGSMGDLVPGDDNSRDWFLYEDQTIGCAMVADLINQGYTSSQASKLIDDCYKDHSDGWFDYYDAHEGKISSNAGKALFEIQEGNYGGVLKKFAKNCEDVKAMHRAKDDDMWSLDFLESIQNSEILYKGDTKSMLSEYSKFLDDPNDYMVNQARKLKSA